MKFILQIVVVLVAAFVFELLLPWWSIAIAAVLGGYLFKSNANFFAGFIAIALLWSVDVWLIDSAAAAPLAEKIAAIFSLNKATLILVTALIGGLVGGFGALTGSLLKRDKHKSLYY